MVGGLRERKVGGFRERGVGGLKIWVVGFCKGLVARGGNAGSPLWRCRSVRTGSGGGWEGSGRSGVVVERVGPEMGWVKEGFVVLFKFFFIFLGKLTFKICLFMVY